MKAVLPVLMVVGGGSTLAQTEQVPEDTVFVEDPAVIIESILELDESESDDSDLLDRLLWLREHPYNLNTVTLEELEALPFVLSDEAAAIIAARRKLGSFVSVAHLRIVSEVSEDLYYRLLPYLYVEGQADQTPSREGMQVSVRSRALRDLQQRAGFTNGTYTGSPVKAYTRISASGHGVLEVGVLAEKDAGERNTDGFISGYASVKDLGVISRLVFGDYTVEAGQGLVFWRGSAFGKSTEAPARVKRSALGVRPYRSADEFHFLRGVALASRIGPGEFAAFGSRRTLAASTDSDGNVTSFYTAGLFRTESERGRKHAVVEKLAGGRLKWSADELGSIGVSGFLSEYDRSVVARSAFEPGGRAMNAFGVDLEAKLGDAAMFAELARAMGGHAAIGGATVDIVRGTTVSLVYRDYSPRFRNMHAFGFGDGSTTTNERGLYLGIQTRPIARTRISGYLDVFTRPWRTSSNPLPTAGREMALQSDVTFARTQLLLRYAIKSSETVQAILDDAGRELRPLVERHQHRARISLIHAASRHLRMRGRLDVTQVDYTLVGNRERGLLMYQDTQFRPSSTLSLEGRLIFFHTDSYDARLYEYENDLPGVFSNPPLYGKGWRWYLLIRWQFVEPISLSVKYAETVRDGVTSIGSGTSTISGDVDNRLSMQLDMQW